METLDREGEWPLHSVASPDMVVVSIGFRAQPHKRAEILSAVEETVERTRRASACGRCHLFVDTADPNAFILMSEWSSSDEAEEFFTSTGFQIFKGIRMLLRDDPVFVIDSVRTRVTRMIRGR